MSPTHLERARASIGAAAMSASVVLVACGEPAPAPPAPSDPGTVGTASVPIDLPDPFPRHDSDVVLEIVIDEAGRLAVDGASLDDDAVKALAEALVARHGADRTRAVIRAGPRTNHGRVVEVMDLLRDAALLRFAIDVVPAVTAVP